MAFADPFPVTINAVTKNLVRTNPGDGMSMYRLTEATQEFVLTIRNVWLKPEKDGRMKARHILKLTQTVFAVPGVSAEITRDATATITHFRGDDPAAFDDIGLAIAGMITAANVVKLNNFES